LPVEAEDTSETGSHSEGSEGFSGSETRAVISSIVILLSGTMYLTPVMITTKISNMKDDLLSRRVKPNQFLNGSLLNSIITKMQ
jgi:hypothetical protein